MKKLLSVAIAAAFAVSSFGTLAQDKKDVKSGGSTATTAGKDAVTTGGGKPKKNASGGTMAKPKHEGKRKTEKQRMEEKK